MKFRIFHLKSRDLFAAIALAALLPSCATRIGPSTIPGARFSYNDTIVRSRDEQLLLNLVRLRYRDTPLFLDIGSIVTQYQWAGSVGASPTIKIDGSTNNEFGFGAGVNYSEQPTITYSPLEGTEFTQRLLTPISPATLILMSESGWSLERLMMCCVQRVNSLANAPAAAGPTPDYVPDNENFKRVTSLLRQLQVAGLLQLQLDHEGDKDETVLQIATKRASAEQLAALDELRKLLDLSAEEDRYYLRGRESAGGGKDIAFTGRSLLATFFFLSQSVEAPANHEQGGLVTVTRDSAGQPFDWTRVTGGLLRIRSAAGEPPEAFSRVKYRGYWFYIADNDLNSKATFSLLTYLFSLQAAEATGASPLLTVPIG